ncbi:MAG: aldehyde dehydrogenase [Verrucomicrobia bacterium]|nr:aldehyde dehydrogenase [Verrucomicrobiota bacterium]
MNQIKVGPVIDGRELADAGGGFADVINPATGEVIARQACCDQATVEQIVESSDRAFHSAAWQGMSPADRGRLLLKVADLVEAEAEKLIELELLDTGKPISQLRGGEIPLTAALIRFYAGAADKIEGALKNTPGGLHLTMYEPYGVVAGVLPWNYPLVNAALKMPPALAAGNAIVLKPSVETPLAAVELAKLCIRAGVPPGIVNVVTGGGSKAGSHLVAHPKIKKVSFTGSTAVGQGIQKLVADQMKPVNLECGGKNAIVVFADADLDRAANAVIFSIFVNCGQLCVSCSRLLIEESVASKFEKILRAKLAKVKVGDPRDTATLVGPMITRSQYDIALSYLDLAVKEGCTVLAGGGRLKLSGPLAKGLWLQPTLLSGVRSGMKVADEEIFGPVLSIIRFRNEAEAVGIANAVEYGLSGSVWTSNVERAGRMIRAMDTGIVWVNAMLAGYPQIPVPPHKKSGLGVELGMEGLLVYCKRKSAVINHDASAPVGWNLK